MGNSWYKMCMADTPNVPDSRPLVVRIYGALKERVTKYGKKKGLKRSTVVKLLTGEALERENH